MASHDEVIQKFARRQLNSRTKTISWSGSRVYCEGDNLYSYGRHFILARYLGERDGQHLFFKNGDKYSSSTSSHQSSTHQHCQGPTAKFSQMASHGIDVEKLTVENIIDFRGSFYEWCYKVETP